VKDMISMEEIKKFLIKLEKEVTKFNDFIRIFKEEMDIFNECFLKLDIKKQYVFNAREQQINAQHKAWGKHMKNKGG
jgi:exonuclease VII small subunit